MTVLRVPLPPQALFDKDPALAEYLMELVSDIQQKLNTLDDLAHQKGRALRLHLITKDDLLTGNLPVRAADYPLLVYAPNLNGDPFLGITDGTDIRAVTLGPPIS